MSQNFTDDCFASGHAAQTDIQNMENNFAALKSAFSGATAPSNPVAGMWWLDTTANILKLRNEANNAWLSVWDFANNKPVITNLSDEILGAMISSTIKDPAIGTAGLRTLGRGAQQAAPGDDPVADEGITYAQLAGVNVGNIYIGGGPAGNCNTTAYSKVGTKHIGHKGAYRFKFTMYASLGTAYAKIYRNGVAVGDQHTAGTSPTNKTEDISGWAAGDLCQMYAHSAHVNYTAYISTCTIYGDFGRLIW